MGAPIETFLTIPMTIRSVCQLFFLLIFLSPQVIIGQEKIDKELLYEDLDVLKANLATYHTGLYTYTSKEDFDEWFTETKNSLQDATALDFFKKLIELNELIQNGHTFFHLNPEQRGKELLTPGFSIYKDKGQFYVRSVEDREYSEIIGQRIISINDVPVEQVFQKLLVYHERDGNNMTQPTEELLFSFPRKYALEYGDADSTLIEVGQNDSYKKIKLPNVPYGKEVRKTDELFDAGGVHFTIKDSMAVLTIETFNATPLKKDGYKAKLKTFFNRLEKDEIKHLAIDVRNNGGGHTDSVEELISYLYNQPFTFYKDVYQNHKRWDPSIIPEINSYPSSSGWALKKGEDGYFRASVGADGTKRIRPKKNTFGGKLYILINGSSLSAAAEFASFMKDHRKTIFIGDEAGGNKVQNTSGYHLIIGLPNAKIVVAIPIILWKMNVSFENDGHGIKPDHWIQNSIEEEINNEDAVLDFAFELMRKSEANNTTR